MEENKPRTKLTVNSYKLFSKISINILILTEPKRSWEVIVVVLKLSSYIPCLKKVVTKERIFFTKKGIEIILATKHNLFCFAWVFNYDCVSEQNMLRNELYWAIWNSKFPSLVSNSNLISTEGALRLPTTYGSYPTHPSHPTKPL